MDVGMPGNIDSTRPGDPEPARSARLDPDPTMPGECVARLDPDPTMPGN